MSEQTVSLKVKTRGDSSPQGKPRVFLAYLKNDFDRCFSLITDDILKFQNCAIYYPDPENEYVPDENDLLQIQLFVIPVTISLFAEDNYVLSEILPFCKKNNRPILPVLYDTAVLSEFNAKFENMQYIDPFSQDGSAEPYEMKLQKYLDSVLISDELAGQVKAAFDAYIFLSYRKKDRVLAQKLMRLIHANPDCRDIAIWYDEFLVPGQSFSESIEQALKSSDVFALAVTPNLLEEGNYVMEIEYKSAAENHVPVVPAELTPTDRTSLERYYKDIPPCVSTDEPSPIKDALLANLKNTALLTNSGDPQHDFFIGLAYLNGIDVEVDHEKALELITSAARSDLPEAREKLVSMYRYGEGVARDPQKAADWQYGLTLTYETAYEENAVDYLTYARSLENLAEMYIENEEYEDAEETLEQLLLLSGEPEFWTKRFDQYAYRRLGDIQAKNLNDREAQYNYRKSLRSISDLRKDNSTVGVWLESALDSYATGMQLLGKDDAAADECFSYAYSIGQRLAQIADDKDVAAEAKRCSILFSCAMAEGPKRTGNLPVAKHFLDNALKNAREMDAEYRSVRTQKDLYVTLNKLGDFYLFNKKETETAAKYYEEGLELTKKVYEALGTENVKTDLAFSLNRLGEMGLSAGEAVEAADLFGQSLELLKEIDQRSSTPKSRQDVAIAEEALTKALRNAGKSGQADEHLENAMQLRKELADTTGSAQVTRDLSINYVTQGDAALAAEDLDKAEKCYKEAADIRHKVLDKTGTAQAKRDLGVVYERLGDVARARKDFSDAQSNYTKQFSLYQEVLDETGSAAAKNDMSIVYNKLGVLYKDQGDNEKALFYYKAAKEYSDEASGSAFPEALRSSFIDNLKIGEALEAQGKLDEALESYQKIYPIAKELRKMAPSDQAERDYFIALIKLGDIAYKKKNNDDAYVYYDEARVISEKLKAKNPGRQAEYDYMYTMQQLGFVKKGKKKWFAFWK